MTKSPQAYGFVYDVNGSVYAFHVEGESPEEAKKRIEAMTEAVWLVPSPEAMHP
jgi:hypothetical protein